MRHETLDPSVEYDALDFAAVWPATTQVAPVPIAEPLAAERPNPSPAPAVPDIPPAVGGIIIGAYVALLAALAVATTVPGQSLFAIGIAAFFLCMFFAVPAVFLGMDQGDRRPPTLRRFMANGMQTMTGHSSGGAALVQMLVVPVCLTLGIVAIGIAAAVIL